MGFEEAVSSYCHTYTCHGQSQGTNTEPCTDGIHGENIAHFTFSFEHQYISPQNNIFQPLYRHAALSIQVQFSCWMCHICPWVVVIQFDLQVHGHFLYQCLKWTLLEIRYCVSSSKCRVNVCSEIFPYLVVIIGLENVLVMTKSIVSTPIQLDVKLRVAQGRMTTEVVPR